MSEHPHPQTYIYKKLSWVGKQSIQNNSYRNSIFPHIWQIPPPIFSAATNRTKNFKLKVWNPQQILQNPKIKISPKTNYWV